MSEGTMGRDGPGSSAPSSAQVTSAVSNQGKPRAPEMGASQSQGQSAGAYTAQTLFRRHPVWSVIGAVALFAVIFGLIFGLGFVSGHGTASTDLQKSTISTISSVDPSVVQIQARSSGLGGGSGVGSGEILTASGYIVTNSHVIHGFTSFNVLLSTGQTVSAQLIGDVPSQDLAVVKINASNLKPISVGNSSQVQVGEYDIAMGSPLGLEQSATSGIVSALNREGQEVVDGKRYTLTGMIQTSAPINPGNSGGALVNLQGQLIGIPTLAALEPSTGVAAIGIGYAISSNQMESVVAHYIPAGS